jgi:hypothetical protein
MSQTDFHLRPGRMKSHGTIEIHNPVSMTANDIASENDAGRYFSPFFQPLVLRPGTWN